MTQPQEHEPTPQETELYEAMTAGDWDTVEQLRQEALGTEDAPVVEEAPAAEPEPELTPDPAEEFEQDLQAAHARYQADNELPEQERVRLTAEAVQRDNHQAMEGI